MPGPDFVPPPSPAGGPTPPALTPPADPPRPAPSPWSAAGGGPVTPPPPGTGTGPAGYPAGPGNRTGPGNGAGPGTGGPYPWAAPAPQPDRRSGRPARGLVLSAVLAGVLAGGAAGAGVVAVTGQDPVPALPRAGTAAPARPAGSLAEVARQVLPSVVSVRVRTGSGGGTGSGFVLDGRGHVLTNAHVVAGASGVTVVDSTGATRTAEVVGVDSGSDLAVLRVAGGGLPPASLGRSAGLAVGDPVLAVGSPLGLSGTVTAGIVSATDRPVSFGDGRRSTAIQTDASINPGNSGGPLVDGAGRVVGVNTQIATLSRAGGNIGIGFAIPIDRAAAVAERLVAGS